jgi:hypothetical protein
VGDSPFQDPGVHSDQQLGDDTEADLRISRRKLEAVIARLKDAATVVRENPGMARKFTVFGPDGAAFLGRVTTRLEAIAYELTAQATKEKRL